MTFLVYLLCREELAGLKEIATTFLGSLLCREELAGGGFGRKVRGSEMGPADLLSSKGSMKAQVKMRCTPQARAAGVKALHPSVASGALKSLSNPGIRRVQAALCAHVSSFAKAQGKTAPTAAWLDAKCLEAIPDPALRQLLCLPPLDDALRESAKCLEAVPDPALRQLLCLPPLDDALREALGIPKPIEESPRKATVVDGAVAE
ncbi:hypothetical protein T484DRAFT_1813976, partial [Baffinella frigidus]